MKQYKSIIEEAIFTAPLTLLSIEDTSIIDSINSYLPYSTGFEIECNQGINFNLNSFEIPNLIDISIDSGEQRFRIPNGLNGLICLYNICEQLKLNSELNPSSGIHYHIDMTDCFSRITKQFVKDNSKYILEELDTWDYKGTYNKRECKINERCWVQFQTQFQTAEIRIGEMSFDYSILVKRIIHANKIVKNLKDKLSTPKPIFEKINKDKTIFYLENKGLKYNNLIQIKKLEEEINQLKNQPNENLEQDLKPLIKKRQIFI